MTLDEICNIKDETEKVNKIYETINEDARLTSGKASRVEFLTTVRYIEKYLKSGDKILDVGAGTGIYSLFFANKGYEVNALELAAANIKMFEKKITSDLKLNLQQGNGMDLSRYEDESFDIVLVFGPLYHLSKLEDKLKCLEEAKRVCKKDGKIFIAFIGKEAAFIADGCHYNPDFWLCDEYDHDTFEILKSPFVLNSVDEAKDIVTSAGIHIDHLVASDGISESLADKIDKFTDEQYAQYIKWHYHSCESIYMLGTSSHLLFVGR